MHDKNGSLLQVGDVVHIPCVITYLHGGEDACNVNLKTIHGRKPDGQIETFASVNTAQVVLIDRPEEQKT